MKDTRYIDGFIGELLHINEVSDNKLVDLNAGGKATFTLSHACVDFSAYALTVAAERYGKTANTVLLDSALSGGEQRVSTGSNTFLWQSWDGSKDVKALHAFISGARKDLIARGNNPMFLSVGALKWRVPVKEAGKEILKDISTPFIIFPVKLITTSSSAPVSIEFIADDVYINPCLVAKLAQIYSQELSDGLPAIGKSLGDPVDLRVLGDGKEYFAKVAEYIKSCKLPGEGTLFEFDKDLVAVSEYNHGELCTYYDIRRNKDKIYSHPLVERTFEKSVPQGETPTQVFPEFVLPRDSVQEKIIADVINGRSLIVKGPPGTGKTVTIANMLAALISRGKKVMFASKKISALTEVYAKLPEPLRKFTMLLDSETEKTAAKMRPDDIKQDFKRLLNDCKNYRGNGTLEADLKQAAAERAKTMRALAAYAELMFGDKCIAGDSFYNALAETCKMDIPAVEFADAEKVLSVTRAQFNVMYENVGAAEKPFAVLTEGGLHEAYKSPFFGIDLDCNSEGAFSYINAIAKASDELNECVFAALEGSRIDGGALTLSEIEGVAYSTLTNEEVGKLIAVGGYEKQIAEIKAILSEIRSCRARPLELKGEIDVKELCAAAEKLSGLSLYFSLDLNEVRKICANADTLNLVGGDAMLSLVSVVGKIKHKKSDCLKLRWKCLEVFDEEKFDGGEEILSEAVTCLARYFETLPEKPKFFDFKAKKIYKKLCGLSFLKSPSFKDITGAIEIYSRILAAQDGISAGKESLCKIYRKSLSDDELDCILAVYDRCKEANKDIRAYVKGVAENGEFIESLYALTDADDLRLGDFSDRLQSACIRKRLNAALENFNKILPVYCKDDSGNEFRLAESLTGVADFIAACKMQSADGATTVQAYQKINALGGDVALKAVDAYEGLLAFSRMFFKNYYTIRGCDNTLADLKILSGQAGNREALAAAASYTAIKNSPQNAINLNDFFYPFEKGEKPPEGASLKDVFAHSFFTLAVRAKNAGLGIIRNGLGARAEENFERLEETDKKLNALNVKLIEGKCLSRIDPDDKDFIFVEDRNPGENMRLLFKRHAQAILKLKSCLILSPYTASLLFDGGEYEKFDVLIIDEASQLEPALALPVLFRTKQCVIVGDEWQMPPIKHFTPLSPVADGGEEGYASLESEISVLGLALRNEGFAVEELICHYRSNTESLIKFSQKLFYPNMKTFPAPEPARKADIGVAGLGIKDVYVENGVVCAGKNVAEADRVVEELKEHFRNYYDEKTHVLSMSVGVVAFGEAQCSLIESKVAADTALSKKIKTAIEKFDDLPEKLVFFKTIETVQGQETGHLILSLTHGRRESGLHMNFGQLNQGKLGRCIFNVAVTRAQSMVTVIHSVRAAFVTAENVSYIREYLETAARFSQDEGGQFVCGAAENAFIESVKNFVIENGIAEERVVINYGVTEGSVRIPVAVLDKTLTRAQLGIWCEKPAGGCDFLDFNMRYPSSLNVRGWKLHRIFIHDWVDNRENEKLTLLKALKEIM